MSGSSYHRGVVDGVVHYCDRIWRQHTPPKDVRERGVYVLLPWCLLDIHKHASEDIAPADPPPKKREMVTCLLCRGIRRKR